VEEWLVGYLEPVEQSRDLGTIAGPAGPHAVVHHWLDNGRFHWHRWRHPKPGRRRR
jgi:hypothetical protein